MFYIVDKATCKVQPVLDAYYVHVRMLGCRMSEYTIIKSDEKGERIVSVASFDVSLEQACINA